jgi:putative intracellular protease/amidase
MDNLPAQQPASALQAMNMNYAEASDPAIMRIVGLVDAMAQRGDVDQLIAPLRPQLRTLRPPRPLRFRRLIFTPLDPLIVPGSNWQPGQDTIPRAVVPPIADHIHALMGNEVRAIEAEIAGKSSTDTDLIARLGRSLWPKAARILATAKMPERWRATKLSEAAYYALANIVSALLAQAALLDTVCAETADGLLPPRPEVIARMLGNTMAASPPALPMLIALILARLPQAASLILPKYLGPEAGAILAALDQATERLLRQLADKDGTEARIAAGTLADAGATAGRIITLLEQLRAGIVNPRRRDQMQWIRDRLDASCRARFTAGLHDEILTPLHRFVRNPDPAIVPVMESAARGLRVLERAARWVGSGDLYDRLLAEAIAAVKADVMRDKLTPVDRVRLVEILAGPDAALAMLEEAGFG